MANIAKIVSKVVKATTQKPPAKKLAEPKAPNKNSSRKIADSQYWSKAIRDGRVGKYEKKGPETYSFEEGFEEGTPAIKGYKSKRIKQAFGRE